MIPSFVARLIRRNVQPLFRPWFSQEDGVVFLGSVVGAPHTAPYVDLYLSHQGEVLARRGNRESDYGCLTIAEISKLPASSAAHYRYAARLAAQYKEQGARYVPCAWTVSEA